MFEPTVLSFGFDAKNIPKFVPNTFGLLIWNVNKNNQKVNVKTYLKSLALKYRLDFVLLQEAKFQKKHTIPFQAYSYGAAANLQIRNNYYGVLTASSVDIHNQKALISKSKESLLNTHKSALLTTYKISEHKELTVVNIHAINFKNSQYFKLELNRILVELREYEDAIIVAGDFNSWNKKRVDILNRFCIELKLSKTIIEKSDKIKSFLNYDLDHIFYRGLTLDFATVLECNKLSDHNPLYAYFKIDN